MKYYLIIIGIMATSCLHRSMDMKHELGRVVEKQYTPATNLEGYSYGLDGDLHYNSLSETDKYMVVLKCEHGVVFPVNHALLYASVEKNDTVLIYYYELLDVDGNVKDYDFESAVPVK